MRHLEKLDFDVISEEEIWEEREVLELKLTEIHQEMVRILIPMMAFIICACIFLAAGFSNFYIGNFVGSALTALAAVYLAFLYKTLDGTVKKFCIYIDKLTVK